MWKYALCNQFQKTINHIHVWILADISKIVISNKKIDNWLQNIKLYDFGFTEKLTYLETKFVFCGTNGYFGPNLIKLKYKLLNRQFFTYYDYYKLIEKDDIFISKILKNIDINCILLDDKYFNYNNYMPTYILKYIYRESDLYALHICTDLIYNYFRKTIDLDIFNKNIVKSLLKSNCSKLLSNW
jgi:hypothetical protein